MRDKIIGILVVTLITFVVFVVVGCVPVKEAKKPEICVTDSCVEEISDD